MSCYKIDIGCGAYKREGFIGVDFVESPGVDYVVNLETDSLPFPDGSCEHVYTSHCLEHIANPNLLFREISRVSCPGAKIEIWVPYAHHNDALLPGHVQYYAEEFWNHVCVQHPDFWHTRFGGCWFWREIIYIVPETIEIELNNYNVDVNFAIRHLNNIVKEICFNFEFSEVKSDSPTLPTRKYMTSRGVKANSLPGLVDPQKKQDPDCRDFSSLTVGNQEVKIEKKSLLEKIINFS